METLISYAHCTDPTGYRFIAYATDEVPGWAVDIKPYFEEVTYTESLKDLLDDVVNSLAILRSFHRKERDTVGVQLTTVLIERVKIERNKTLDNT